MWKSKTNFLSLFLTSSLSHRFSPKSFFHPRNPAVSDVQIRAEVLASLHKFSHAEGALKQQKPVLPQQTKPIPQQTPQQQTLPNLQEIIQQQLEAVKSESEVLGMQEARAYLQSGEIDQAIRACLRYSLTPSLALPSPQNFKQKEAILDLTLEHGLFSHASKWSKHLQVPFTKQHLRSMARSLKPAINQQLVYSEHYIPDDKDVLLALETLMSSVELPLNKKTGVLKEAVKCMSPALMFALLNSQTRRFLIEYLDKEGWNVVATTACRILIPEGCFTFPSKEIVCPQVAVAPTSLVSSALPLFSCFKKAPSAARRLIFQFLLLNNEIALAHVASHDFQLSSNIPLLHLDSSIKTLFVNSEETLIEAEEALRNTDIVGVDSEFFPHNAPKAVILQVATRTTAMVFDLTYAPNVSVLANLLRNPQIIKIGQSFDGDMLVLRRHSEEFHHCHSLVDMSTLLHHLFPSFFKKLPVGLARLTALFLARRLCKREQMSNWSRRPLTDSQLHYAALDAYVLILLADAFLAHPSFPPHLTLAALSRLPPRSKTDAAILQDVKVGV